MIYISMSTEKMTKKRGKIELPKEMKLEYIGCERYRLLDNIVYPTKHGIVVVKQGFTTDFASVPRFLWGIFPPDSNYAYAAVLHDWLYASKIIGSKKISRRTADRIFYDTMRKYGVNNKIAFVFWMAVRLFGKKRWKEAKGV